MELVLDIPQDYGRASPILFSELQVDGNSTGRLQEKVDSLQLPLILPSGLEIPGFLDGYKNQDGGQPSDDSSKKGGPQGDQWGKDAEFDLVVVGGGSGGISAARTAAQMGKKVALLDFVTPTPLGTTWGLGGTCVNVGCIPKKLMHHASLIARTLRYSGIFGWNMSTEPKHSWKVLRDRVWKHIRELNWGYQLSLRKDGVKYINAYGTFLTERAMKVVDRDGQAKVIRSKYFIVATGERPDYPNIPGARELGVTSDDLFSLESSPGATLIVGASYVALECAGLLRGLGLDVTVMVRSIFLRGFDQDMAERIGKSLQAEGVSMLRPCVPLGLERVGGRIKVSASYTKSAIQISLTFDTVVFAVGRTPCTRGLGLEEIGVKLHPDSGRIVVRHECTSVVNVYAVGDVTHNGIQLTPVAIRAGQLLARRIFKKSKLQCDYHLVPTTVFTPLEYSCIGLSEEDAITKHGSKSLIVYHSSFSPLEWSVGQPVGTDSCYCKLICLSGGAQKVVGFHYLGPEAGEVAQGFALAMKVGATKADLDATIGIHPTCAEIFTSMTVIKGSGKDAEKSPC